MFWVISFFRDLVGGVCGVRLGFRFFWGVYGKGCVGVEYGSF